MALCTGREASSGATVQNEDRTTSTLSASSQRDQDDKDPGEGHNTHPIDTGPLTLPYVSLPLDMVCAYSKPTDEICSP